MQAINATRPGGHMGFVGVNYELTVPGTRVAPGGGEQQHRGGLPVVAFLAVGFAVAVDVLLTEQWDTHQPIFSASSTMIPAGPRT
jgi:hypothetical protein